MRKSKIRTFFSEWFIFILIVLGGILLVYQLFYVKNNPSQNLNLINQDYSDDWSLGNKDAKLVLVYYSDFECPACAYYHQFLDKLLIDFKDQILIIFRHFPLPNHLKSKDLAYAAEAAGKQNKFWEMADLIFKNQSKLVQSRNLEKDIIDLAVLLNLDIDKFKTDLVSKEVKNKVEENYLEALKMNLRGTPSFFLNGKRIYPPSNYIEFKEFLQKQIDGLNSN